MSTREELLDLIEAHIDTWVSTLPETSLYTPMGYLMKARAKRVRPMALLMACELYGGDPLSALDEALAIELFHNFTLMHDDIMDNAPLRRGLPSVHEKWNVNTAILSGDAMLVKAYQLMYLRSDILAEFSQHALAVCEGQELDLRFETRANVALEEYELMIRNKTAALLACALKVGAMKANAPSSDVASIGDLGEQLGMAFQLQDDLLDAFGDPARMGKRLGGDLREGKKTFLLIKGVELSAMAGRTELVEELSRSPSDRDVDRMIRVLQDLDVPNITKKRINDHHAAALNALDRLSPPAEKKASLKDLCNGLVGRSS